MHLQGFVGIASIIGFALLLSTDRRSIRLRPVIGAVLLQFLVAILVFNVPPVTVAVEWLARRVTDLLELSGNGASFLFGPLASEDGPAGFVFAFKVLPILIFFSSLVAILYYLRVMQLIVAGLAFVLRRTLGVTGLESLAVAANVFLGQTEAPLCVKPFLPTMTKSQLMVVMTSGFATVAGSVLLGYVEMLGAGNDELKQLYAKHLITASLMSAPGAFAIAKIVMPETEDAPDERSALSAIETPGVNIFDAAARGARDGLFLALNVGAMLIAFIALIALLDWPLAALGTSTAELLGYAFWPAAWAIGIEASDAGKIGGVMGLQIMATEFVAYLELASLIKPDEQTGMIAISERSGQIAAYALCGFCNFASIGIQLGGLGTLAPSRREDFARIVFRAMLGGMLACWMTASVASIFI
ncbi:MAG: nucleoside transporter C-terminal domain-containing protein [Planctomycetota bacterium]